VFLYEPVKDKPQITFVQARKDAASLPLNVKRLAERKALVMSKMEAMQSYVSSSDRCRMLMLQHYFDEKTLATCGICDVCLERKKKENQHAFKDMRNEVLTVVRQDAFTLEQVEEIISPKDNTLFIDVVRDLVDEGIIEYDSAWRLKIIPPENHS